MFSNLGWGCMFELSCYCHLFSNNTYHISQHWVGCGFPTQRGNKHTKVKQHEYTWTYLNYLVENAHHNRSFLWWCGPSKGGFTWLPVPAGLMVWNMKPRGCILLKNGLGSLYTSPFKSLLVFLEISIKRIYPAFKNHLEPLIEKWPCAWITRSSSSRSRSGEASCIQCYCWHSYWLVILFIVETARLTMTYQHPSQDPHTSHSAVFSASIQLECAVKSRHSTKCHNRPEHQNSNIYIICYQFKIHKPGPYLTKLVFKLDLHP